VALARPPLPSSPMGPPPWLAPRPLLLLVTGKPRACDD
jgi:hypothetical protein